MSVAVVGEVVKESVNAPYSLLYWIFATGTVVSAAGCRTVRGIDEVEGSFELEEEFRPATQLAMEGGKAATCNGGRLTGLAFLGSVDINVYKTVRRILVNIRGCLPFRTSSP